MRTKHNLNTRRGFATIELLIAIPILTTVFVTLMVLAHASYKRNDDYSQAYRTLMNRHTLSLTQFHDSKTTKLVKETDVDRSSSKSSAKSKSSSKPNSSSNVVASFFPPTESWSVEASQPINFLPSAFAEVYAKKTAIRGTIYKGTGSPDHRALFPDINFDLPASDEVKALAIAEAIRAVTEAVDADFKQLLDRMEDIQNLLSAIESVKALADVDIDAILNQAKEAGKEAAKQLVEFIKEEAKELAKSAFTRDWEKIRRLREQIQLTRDSLEQLALAQKQLIKILDADEEFTASEEQ